MRAHSLIMKVPNLPKKTVNQSGLTGEKHEDELDKHCTKK